MRGDLTSVNIHSRHTTTVSSSVVNKHYHITICKAWSTLPPELLVKLGNSIVGWRQFYTASSIGWTFLRGLNTSSVWWCTGVCTDRHPATLLITSSQPPTLLLAAPVYDLPTGTVSLCLAVDSARTAVGLSTTPARQSGTRCLMNLEILTVLIVLNGLWKQFSLAATSVSSGAH